MMNSFLKNTKTRLHNAPAWQRKTFGVLLVLYGFIALITPITPGSWLLFVGLELLGIRLLFVEKLKARFLKKD